MKALSFFSGCLGLDLGLEQAGIKTLLYCENDKFAKSTIKHNRPNTPLIDDILDFNGEDIKSLLNLKDGEIDIIVGGPPCQAFSTAGKRASFEDPRGNVFLHFVSMIEQFKPSYFVIENVRGLLSAALKHRPHSERGANYPSLTPEELPGGALAYVLQRLGDSNYDISFNLYNTANYGVPQKRERLIIIGSLNGRVPYLKPTHSEVEGFNLPSWKSFRSVASDLNEADQEYIKFSDKRIEYYKHLKGGQNWRDLPAGIVEQAMGASYHSGGGKTGFYRRISWDEPSPTLVTHPAMPATDLCHPEIIRPLSVGEYKRIQQFPDNYDILGTTIQKYKQIGNAVPVGFGRVIGEALMDHKNRKNIDTEEFKNFPFSRYKKTSDLTWGDSISKSNAQTAFNFD